MHKPEPPITEHPYSDLPPSRFWKTAIADIEPMAIADLWQPKFPITKASRIVTVGSCFAQHISKSLQQQGFNWIDAEPAPPDMPQQQREEHGYGVFSFRTANIYSAALLKQWIFWATGRAQASTEVFQDQGRYYDPFRPTIPAQGYESPEALFAAREKTFQAIATALTQTDLFIFTLGLTEAWKNTRGDTYPMCPGTLRGQFSAASHIFHNFSYEEIIADLRDVFDALRQINPQIRFLLTVSPVPLTATAAQEHVLTATTYSKSVLRAVAGHLAHTHADIDYFPSYELITAAPFKGQFFEANLRSVTPAGVDFVMGRFRAGLEAAEQPHTPIAASATGTGQAVASSPATAAVGGSKPSQAVGDAICEDIILETWSKSAARGSAVPPRIVLIGDSHMGMIANALDEIGVPYAGGAIMQASQWHHLQFVPMDEGFFVPTDPAAKARWDETWQKSFAQRQPQDVDDLLIITNIGAQSTQFGTDDGFAAYLIAKYQKIPFKVDMLDVKNYILHARPHHIDLVRRIVKAGYKVVWVSDPPAQTVMPEVFRTFDEVLVGYLAVTGCSVFNAREWVSKQGGFSEKFKSTEIEPSTGVLDAIHGSPEYYRELVQEIFRVNSFQIVPMPGTPSIAPPLSRTQISANKNLSRADEICEDIILETWSSGTSGDHNETPSLVLIGDSHMGMFTKAFDELDVPYVGGAIMNGTEWHNLEFVAVDDIFFVPLKDGPRSRWDETWKNGLSRIAPDKKGDTWIITNIGAHTHTLFHHEYALTAYLKAIHGKVPQPISATDVRNYLMYVRQRHLNLVEGFVKAGYKVLWVTDPPFQPFSPDLFFAFDFILSQYFEAAGCTIFNVRDWLNQLGGIPAEFKSTEISPDTGELEYIHGSPAYYRQLAEAICKKIAIQVPAGVQ